MHKSRVFRNLDAFIVLQEKQYLRYGKSASMAVIAAPGFFEVDDTNATGHLNLISGFKQGDIEVSGKNTPKKLGIPFGCTGRRVSNYCEVLKK